MRIINLEQGTPEWEASRRETFNASECGLLFECSPFHRKENQQDILALIKYHGLKEYQNKAMIAGLEFEPVIREYVEKLIGEPLEPLVGCYDEDERFRASFDGITFDGLKILEVKNSKNTYEHVTQYGEPPRHYLLQVQQQLLVSGAVDCLFAVRNPETGEIVTVSIAPDKEMQKEIIERWLAFEKKYKNAPAPIIEDEEERTDEEWQTYAEKIKELNGQIKALDEELKEYKEAVIAMAGGRKAKGCGIQVYPVTRNTVDYKAIITQNKIDTAPFTKSTTSWTVKIS